jgi:hypothetical protein
MAFILADRVKETSITQGLGAAVLSGPFGGFQSFAAAIGDNNRTFYTIENESQWEVGIGTYTSSSNSLSRDTVLRSSNGGGKISLAGVSIVFCTYAADRSVYLNDEDLVDLRGHSGILLDRSSLLSTGTLLHDVRVSGQATFIPDANSKISLTLIRNVSGNFIHAYRDDANDRTIGLYTDGQSNPTWRLGLKNNPNNVYDPPDYGYVYGKDGTAGLAPNSINKLELTNTAGLNYTHNNSEVLRATSTTGVYINSLSTTYPALTVKGGPSTTSSLQEWKNFAGSTLSLVDKNGYLAVNRTSASYQIDVSGSGRFDAIVFGDGTIQTTAYIPSSGVISSGLNYKNVSNTYSLSLNDDVIFLDPSLNDINISLPSASGAGGKEFYFKKKPGLYNVTINPPSGQTIDGQSNFAIMYDYEAVSIISDNQNWYIF